MKFGSCLFVAVAFTLIVPSVVFAEYDVNRIKTAIEKEKSFFGVTGWERTESGGVQLASSSIEGMVLSVGVKISGFMAGIGDSTQANEAILRCVKLGDIGLEPSNDIEHVQVFSAVSLATTNLKKLEITLNKVTLEVEPQQLMGTVIFSCFLKPAGSD